MPKAMRRPSGFVLFLLLGVLVIAMCAGGVFVYATRMPNPATADLNGLLRWLVTRDLSREPIAVQEQLLARLEDQLRKGLELGEAREQLTDVQRSQLLANADVLGRLWFYQQVDRYFASSDADRPSFLNAQIDEIQRSGVVQALAALIDTDEPSASSEQPTQSLWVRLNERTDRWTAPLAPQHKARAERFVAAVQGNLLIRTLRASFGSSG
jgi:hypothetical protein